MTQVGIQQLASGIGQLHAHQPVSKFWRVFEAEQFANVQRIVEGGALVIEHDVIGSGHPDEEGEPGIGQQGQQGIHIILIRLGVTTTRPPEPPTLRARLRRAAQWGWEHLPEAARAALRPLRGQPGSVRPDQSRFFDLGVDTRAAAATDDLARTVDYGAVAAGVVAAIERDPVDLIETLAQRIADGCLAFDLVQAVEVVVHKPQAPVGVPFGDVTVTITRQR